MSASAKIRNLLSIAVLASSAAMVASPWPSRIPTIPTGTWPFVAVTVPVERLAAVPIERSWQAPTSEP